MEKPRENTFTHTGHLQLISKKQAEKLAMEADVKLWSMCNTFNAVAIITSMYSDSIVSLLKNYGYKQEQYKSIQRWAKQMSTVIDTFQTFLQPFYKDKELQGETIKNITMMLFEAVSVVSSVRPDGEFINQEEFQSELAIIPKKLRALIDASPGLKDEVKFFSDMVKESIEENDEIMRRKGIDNTNYVEIIYKNKIKQ